VIRESRDSTFSKKVLGDGATLLVQTTPGSPLVSVAFGFRGGFIDERDQELGLTSLTLEHMLRGTRTRSAEQLADDVEGLGGGISVSVDRDGFGIGLTVLSDYLDDALAVLGDAVCEPGLLPATFEGVRTEALAELGEAEDHPLRRTLRRLRPLLFPGHPYGRPVRGTRESLTAARPGATASWHHSHFVSDRLIVCMVGGVSPERAEGAIDETLCRLGVSEVPETTAAPPPRPAGRVEEELEQSGQSSVAVGFPGPRVGTRDAVALHVAASAMTMMSGRLWRLLRERPPHAYSVRLTPTPMRAGGALIGHVTTPPGEEEAAVAVFVRELDELSRHGLTNDELDSGRRYLAGLMEISMQRGATRAAAYAVAEVVGIGYERITRLPDIVRDVTNEDVISASRQYVSAEDEPAVVILRG
jgi:zinc protease